MKIDMICYNKTAKEFYERVIHVSQRKEWDPIMNQHGFKLIEDNEEEHTHTFITKSVGPDMVVRVFCVKMMGRENFP